MDLNSYPKEIIVKRLPARTAYFLTLTLVLSGVLGLSLMISTQRVRAFGTITVTNTNDSGTGSLRKAIADASFGDTIEFAANVTGTITLTSGELLIDNRLTINGPGAKDLTISGNHASRVFRTTGDTVTINGLTIANGNGSGNDGSLDGGGIFNRDATLIINFCAILHNSSQRSGGGIRNTGGTLIVNHSTISFNTAGDDGGGISIAGNATFGASLTINNSTISFNTAGKPGGGIFNGLGKLSVINSTITGNRCDVGNEGVLFHGGGVYTEGTGTDTLINTIIAGNFKGASNSTPTDIDREGLPIATASHNLIGDTGTSGGIQNGVNGNIVGLNPMLGPLQDNGGPTSTIALLPGSPAINAGSNILTTITTAISGNLPVTPSSMSGLVPGLAVRINAGLADAETVTIESVTDTTFRASFAMTHAAGATVGLAMDQRRVTRPRQGTVDIGAFESRGFTIAVTSGSGQSAPINLAFANPLVVTVSGNNDDPVSGGALTFMFGSMNGAGATFASNPVIIQANGQASVTATANGTIGSYQVKASANGTDSDNFELTNACQVITVNPTTLSTSGTVGSSYSQQFSQSGGQGAITWSMSGSVPGLTLDSNGKLSGTPSQSGTFSFTIEAKGVNQCSGSQMYQLTINCPTVTLNPASLLATGTVGTLYSRTITPVNGTAPFTFEVSGLPNDITANSTNTNVTLSGTPTKPSSSTVTVKVKDAYGCASATATYTLVINCQTITVTPPNVTSAIAGTAFAPNQYFTQAGSTGSVTFSKNGTLPNGMTLSSNGLLSGTPTQTGPFPITVKATDSNGCSGTSATYTLNVNCPTITATVGGSGAIRPGQSAIVTVSISGVTTNHTVTLNSGATMTGPSPLSFTVNPTTTTTYSIASVTDANGCAGTFSGSATVIVDGTAPTIVSPGNQVGVINGTTGPVSYSMPTINDNNPGVTVTCTPYSSFNFPLGTTTVTCTATDVAGNTAQCSFTVTVRTPRAALNNLKTQVQALVPGTLTQAQANQMISYLELASTHLEQGNNSAACTDLANFIAKCNAFGPAPGTGPMNAAQRDNLVSYANKIGSALGVCGG